jgi:hypothetical protein
MHVFLRFVLPDLFCKLGEEWVPKQAKALTGEAGGLAGKGIGILEIIALVIIDLILLILLLIILTIIVWISESLVLKILATGEKVWEWLSVWD